MPIVLRVCQLGVTLVSHGRQEDRAQGSCRGLMMGRPGYLAEYARHRGVTSQAARKQLTRLGVDYYKEFDWDKVAMLSQDLRDKRFPNVKLRESRGYYGPSQSQCRYGHTLQIEHVMPRSDGFRQCWACSLVIPSLDDEVCWSTTFKGSFAASRGRIIYTLFLGQLCGGIVVGRTPTGDDQVVGVRCGNYRCVRPSHLIARTRSEMRRAASEDVVARRRLGMPIGMMKCDACLQCKPNDQFKLSYDGYRYRSCNACIKLRASAAFWSRRTNATVDEWLHRFAVTGLRSGRNTIDEQRHLRRLRKLREMDANRERPWIRAEYRHKVRARELKCHDDGTVTAEALKDLFEVKNCIYCGRELDAVNRQIDHMIPLVDGGMHSLRNIVMSCAYCNQWKGDHDFGWWLMRVKEPFRTRVHDHFVNCYARMADNIHAEKFGSLCG